MWTGPKTPLQGQAQGWTGHLAYRASSRWAVDPMWAGPVRYVLFFSLSLNSLQLGRPMGNRGLAVCGQHRHILLVYVCHCQSIMGWLAQRALTVLSITTQTRVGGTSWHGPESREPVRSWKRPGGAEKPLEMEVKCSKLTDLFGAGVHTPAGAAAPGDERVEAYMLSNVSLGLARLHFETCQKQSRKRFYIECDVT